MQNFQLSTNFKTTAKQLDRARCGKQRLETADALAMLLGQPAWMSYKQFMYISKKYKNHPAWRMWIGYEPALIEYGLTICQEWIDRECQDTFYDKILVFNDMLKQPYSVDNPPWLTEEFCSNHRAVMLGKIEEKIQKAIGNDKKLEQAYKTYDWYSQFGWAEQPSERVNGRWPYLWPEVV